MGWGAALGSAFGGILNFGSSMSQQANDNMLAAQNIALQREFAQNGIRWRVDDAKAAGVHPLFAMGASTTPFTPVTVGGGSSMPDMSSAFSSIGQAFDRSRDAAATQDERDQRRHDALHVTALQTERMALENQLLRSQIVRSNQQIGPPMPSLTAGGGLTGQQPGVVGPHIMKPAEVTTMQPRTADVEAGPARPQSILRNAGGGRYQNFPSNDAISDQEATNPLMLRWLLTQSWRKPPESQWPKGAMDMRWGPLGWEPVYGGRSSGRYIGPSSSIPGVRSGMHYLQTTRGRY